MYLASKILDFTFRKIILFHNCQIHLTFKTLSERAHGRESSPCIVLFYYRLYKRHGTWTKLEEKVRLRKQKGKGVACMESEKPKQMNGRGNHLTFIHLCNHSTRLDQSQTICHVYYFMLETNRKINKILFLVSNFLALKRN